MSIFTNPASRGAEQANAYTAAILALIGSSDPIEALSRTAAELEHALRGLTDEEVAHPEAPGKWSLRELLQHLADSELVWGYRLRMVLAQDRPVLTGYDQDLWAERLGYSGADAAEALREFAARRESNLRLLARASSDDLLRVGVHAERGEESVEHMIRLYAGHDLAHLRQLARIIEAVRG
jgi:uncharacterized damage-inducible protein DinB